MTRQQNNPDDAHENQHQQKMASSNDSIVHDNMNNTQELHENKIILHGVHLRIGGKKFGG